MDAKNLRGKIEIRNRGGFFRPEQAGSVSSVTNIGQALFTKYAFAFEVTSILILVAMVGAVVLARREHH